MAMNEMDMGEMRPDESMQSITMENMETEAKQDPIEIVKQDHRKVEGLFKQFEDTDDKKQKFEIAKQICMELTVHAKYEEEIVYPYLLEEDEDAGEEAELEHELVKFMISQIETSNARDKALEPKVKVLKELVEHHVEEEEGEMLPEIEDNQELKGRVDEILARKQELMQQLKSGKKVGSKSGRKTASSSRSASSKGKKAATTRKSTTTKRGASSKSSSTSRSKSAASSRKTSVSKKPAAKKGSAGKTASAKKGGNKGGASKRGGKKSTGRRGR